LLDGAATLPAHEPFLRFGHTGVDDATCRKLIASFSSDAAARPVVKNRLQRSAASGEFPGVDSFILVPITKTDRQIGWLIAVNRLRCDESDVLPPDTGLSHLEFGTCEATLLSSAASILATHARNVALFREKEQLLTHMVLALVSTIEAKDDYTCGHSERVALFSKRLGGEMGLDADACERLYLTGLMHDVGKIGVSDATLNKPGKLTKEEFEEIKQHPDTGWSILHEVKHLRYALPGVLYHHERYDGAGYPDGLAGEAIPLDGRILAVCDAYDAMTSDRPYRAGMPQEKAESVLREGAGTQWDPVAIGAFFRILPDILEIRASHRQRPQPKRQHNTIDAQAE
jgi:HD-GYP domain-containing protein (c-di-GMP phosphodiesterase class II)